MRRIMILPCILHSWLVALDALPDTTAQIRNLMKKSGTLYRGSDDWKNDLNRVGGIRTVYFSSGDDIKTGYKALYTYMPWISKNGTKASFTAAVGFDEVVIVSTIEELKIIYPKNRGDERKLQRLVRVGKLPEQKDAYSICYVEQDRRYDLRKHQLRDYTITTCITELQLAFFKELVR